MEQQQVIKHRGHTFHRHVGYPIRARRAFLQGTKSGFIRDELQSQQLKDVTSSHIKFIVKLHFYLFTSQGSRHNCVPRSYANRIMYTHSCLDANQLQICSG